MSTGSSDSINTSGYLYLAMTESVVIANSTTCSCLSPVQWKAVGSIGGGGGKGSAFLPLGGAGGGGGGSASGCTAI